MTNLSGANFNNGAADDPKGEGRDSPSIFPAYPAYNDSGIDWLGDVPEHWSVLPVKWVGWLKGGAGFPHDKQGVNSYELDFHKVNALAAADSEGVLRSSENTITRETAKELGAYVFPEGTIVFAKVGAALLLGRLRTISAESCIDNNMMGLIVFQGKVSNQFALYSMGTVRFDLIANPGAVPSLNEGQIGNYRLAIPSLLEQTQIARFLDHETARIDALIEEQQRLIELLKEKRQAVISHAVTKGLDPTVPMKDSGVKWLGEVPAHWVVGPLRWYATIQGGIAKGKDYEGRETVSLPYLRVANVQNGFVDLTEVKEISVLESEVVRYSLRLGDVLMNEGGDNDKLGRGTVWQGQIEPCLHQNHVFAIRPNDLLSAEWLTAYTQCDQARSYFFLNSKQSTNLASISASNVMSLALPIPSAAEQKEILSVLNEGRVAHEELVNLATSTVEFLKERRSALISAAVTGKIDVRGWQPPARAQSPELAEEAV